MWTLFTFWAIYTTKGAASPKSVLKIGLISTRTVSIDTNHRVHLSTPTYCQSATFGPLDFCVCPLFFTTKIINFAIFCCVVFILIARWRYRRLLKTAHDFARLGTTAQLSTVVDFYSFITKISFYGSRRFIFTGSCSATHGLLLQLSLYTLLIHLFTFIAL